MGIKDREMGYFMLLSLLVHITVVAAWSAAPPRFAAESGSPLQIALRAPMTAPPADTAEPRQEADKPERPRHQDRAARSVPAPSQQSAPAPRDKPRPPEQEHSPPQQKQATQPRQPMPPQARDAGTASAGAAAENQATAKQGSSRETPQPPDKTGNASQRPSSGIPPLQAAASRLRDDLIQRLRARFDYPLIARKKGWEGRVKLGMRVEADGRLSNLRVIETSGYAILDRASLRTLKQIARVPAAGEQLHGRYVDLILPVEYRLTEGG